MMFCLSGYAWGPWLLGAPSCPLVPVPSGQVLIQSVWHAAAKAIDRMQCGQPRHPSMACWLEGSILLYWTCKRLGKCWLRLGCDALRINQVLLSLLGRLF